MAQQQHQTPAKSPGNILKEQDAERAKQAKEAQAEREKSNNPATQEFRQYDADAPGMHPANQPAEDTKYYKGTRLDLEDITGNPGHRGVNPDAPATSINPADRQVGESINEPKGIDQGQTRADVKGVPPLAGTGVMGSINEPPGSTIGGNMDESGQPDGGLEPLVLSGISPESVPMGGATFALTATGSGFNEDCVIVFNDEDQDTTLVSPTELNAAAVAISAVAETVDVEVARGDELSEVITFEFTAVGAQRTADKKAARKPSKGKRPPEKRKQKKK